MKANSTLGFVDRGIVKRLEVVNFFALNSKLAGLHLEHGVQYSVEKKSFFVDRLE